MREQHSSDSADGAAPSALDAPARRALGDVARSGKRLLLRLRLALGASAVALVSALALLLSSGLESPSLAGAALGLTLALLALGAGAYHIERRVVPLARKGLGAGQRLRAALRRQGRAVRAKDRFLHEMSDALRAPMNGVLGLGQLLLEEELPATHRQKLRAITGGARAMLRIVEDIQHHAALRSGSVELSTAPGSLRELLRGSVELLAFAASDRGIELSLVLSPELPDYVELDAARLQQLIVTLIQHVLDHTDAGFVRVHAEVAGAPEPSAALFRLRVRVRDDELEVPANSRPIPTPAGKRDGEPAPIRHPGSGLGLSIATQLAALMRGTIDPVPPSGAGPLELTLPLRRATPRSEPPPPFARRQLVRLRARAPVLVVDEHDVDRFLASTLLASLGLAAELATSGARAIDLVQAKRYALILMACRMAAMDGADTTRRIRALEQGGARTPIIGCVVGSLVEERGRMLAAGMDDCVSKPMTRSALYSLLREWLPEEVVPASSGARPTRPPTSRALPPPDVASVEDGGEAASSDPSPESP